MNRAGCMDDEALLQVVSWMSSAATSGGHRAAVVDTARAVGASGASDCCAVFAVAFALAVAALVVVMNNEPKLPCGGEPPCDRMSNPVRR